MQPNLFYLSGPHGSGKTTLEQLLKEADTRILVPELISNAPKFDIEPVYRQRMKLCERAIENYEYLKLAREHPERLVLGNRCLYDVLAYHWVYYAKGWISQEEFNFHNRYAQELFLEENASPNCIVLNPSYPVVQRHLEERWKSKPKKWGEDDERYTQLACEVYERLEGRENVFYIDHEINLQDSPEIPRILRWMKQRGAQKEQVHGEAVPLHYPLTPANPTLTTPSYL
ncbi:MAG: AAA family ATPase [Nanoarchaeota archaeon]